MSSDSRRPLIFLEARPTATLNTDRSKIQSKWENDLIRISQKPPEKPRNLCKISAQGADTTALCEIQIEELST